MDLYSEFLNMQDNEYIAPEMGFSDYVRECEGKNGTLTALEITEGGEKLHGADYAEILEDIDGELSYIFFNDDGDCLGYSFPDCDGGRVFRACTDSEKAWRVLRRMGFID